MLTRNYDENIYNNTIEFLSNPYNIELKIDSKKTQQLNQVLNICSYWLFDLLYYIYNHEIKYFNEIYMLKKHIKNISINNIYTCWQYLTEVSQYYNFSLNTKLILNMFTYKYQDIFINEN